MRIVYLHQYFFTRSMVGIAGNRSYEFARRLVAMGHQVDMVTSYTYDQGHAHLDWFETEEDGIRVHWLPVPYSNKMDFKKRVKAFFRFAIRASRKAVEIEADVVIATSGPLTIAVPGIFASWYRNIPFVFEVRDLWPEGAIQLNVLTNPMAKWLARRLERFAYARSRHIVALSPGMRDGIAGTGVSASKVTIIPNAADIDLFQPDADGSEVREKYGLNSYFTLAYFGTMGLANGLNFVLDAAAELKAREVTDIRFLLHGDGMERPYLEKRARDEGLDNVLFTGPTPKDEMAKFLAGVDVCMTIFKNAPVLQTSSPNKMFDALAAGKPVLTNMPGWLESIAVRDKTGVFIKPDDPIDFADKVIWMRDHPDALREFGKNARRIAEERFSRDVLARQLECVLLSTQFSNANSAVKKVESVGERDLA
ncbi:glycosyltransferase family 4 protein [Microvirga splendida]|uniref:Glycosyltransferase family 4 protein n=1 Tax=Microvirga splendida TaxID=2795727 RepID=A0ABS0Y9A1_9HYPH|nr:glycosyltransferase family 4 protein [Microvirga splendida]MBJ6128540.1 glycosyltransferase family 4 protein [Microvirga splendida]